jgi:hypothetical protein
VSTPGVEEVIVETKRVCLWTISSCNDGVDSIYTESDFKVDASKAALMKLTKYYDISSELATVLDARLKLQFYKSDKNPSVENPEDICSYVEHFYERLRQ